MKAVSIFGSPGTGKSTRLISIIERLLEKYAPHDISLVSFTKAAAQEMSDRCQHPIGASTVHSVCFRLLQLQRSMVVDRGSLIKFGNSIGLEISWGNLNDESSEMTEGDEYVAIYDLARNRKEDYKITYSSKGTLGNAQKMEYFAESYENWKREYGLYDFTDMLSRVVEFGLFDQTLKVLLVDEAQDLSPLQWDVVNSWCQYLQICYIAGDDDQAIFEWSGADPQGMIKFSDKYESKIVVLEQSWRVPETVHTLANEIIHQIDDRLDKVYKPQPKEGSINRFSDISDIAYDIDHTGDVLLLYRNHSLRKDIEEFFIQIGIPYLVDNGKPSPLESKYGKLVLDWQRLQDGRNLKPMEMQKLIEALNLSNVQLSNNNISDWLHVSWQQAISDHWWQLYTYFETLERKHKKSLLELYEECNLHLSTIHGAKGREAERVILINGMGAVTAASYMTDRDGEIRVFYVGVTRAKHDLDIVLGDNPVEFLL